MLFRSGAFYNCKSLQNANLPDSLEEIGDAAFFKCWSLQSVSFGASLKQVGEYAFWNCDSLKKIEVSNALKKIDFKDAEFTFQETRNISGETKEKLRKLGYKGEF